MSIEKKTDYDLLNFRLEDRAKFGDIIISDRRMDSRGKLLARANIFAKKGCNIVFVCPYPSSAEDSAKKFQDLYGVDYINNVQFLSYSDFISGKYSKKENQSVMILDIISFVQAYIHEQSHELSLVASSVLVRCTHSG